MRSTIFSSVGLSAMTAAIATTTEAMAHPTLQRPPQVSSLTTPCRP